MKKIFVYVMLIITQGDTITLSAKHCTPSCMPPKEVPMHMLKRGILITIEGIDGSGKSTLAKNIKTLLMERNFPVAVTKEPGGTLLGQQLRTLVQEKTIPICSHAEFLLFAADRAQHFQEYIMPQLQQQKIIISDRSADSSLVYQGYGRGLSIPMIAATNAWAMNDIKPDLTIYLKISAQEAAARIAARNETLTSFEKEKQEFRERLIQGFDTIFAPRNNVITIDAHQSLDTVTNQALEALLQWLNTNQLIAS